MKKLLIIVLLICGLVLFSAAEGISFKIFSYQISTRQTANQYTKAELIITPVETLVEGSPVNPKLPPKYELGYIWEIILHRKDGKPSESIKLEKHKELGVNHGVFDQVTITEAAGVSGSNLFAYVPTFEGNRIRVDLCDKRTEGTKRRLIMEY